MTVRNQESDRSSGSIAPLAALICVMVMFGCSPSEESSLAKARELLGRNDVAAAAVQLKSALERHPKSATGRFMLGSLLLEKGDADAAVIELAKAAELKFPEAEVLPMLARAMVRAGQAKKLVDRFEAASLADPKSNAAIKASLGAAYWQLGDRQKSERALDDALTLNPSQADALLLRASIRLVSGDAAGAKAAASQLLASEPTNANALQALGLAELQLTPQKPAVALDHFRRAVAAKPEFAAAHSAIIGLLQQQGDSTGARAQFQVMHKVLPKHLLTGYWEAQFALIDGNLRKAREITQALLRLAPDSANLNTLAGSIELQGGGLRLAEEYFTKALNQDPNARPPRRLLAQTYLRLDQTTKALAAIGPLLDAGNDPDALTLAGEIHLHAGDLQSAAEAFKKSAALSPGDSRARVAAALIRLQRGDAKAGFAELAAVAAEDTTSYGALALVSARMRAKDKQGALAALQLLEQKSKRSAVVPFLRGRILQSTGDKVAARAAYEEAVQIDRSYLGPALALARLDMADGAVDKAGERFDTLLGVDPTHVAALLAKAELAARKGASAEEVLKLIDKAVRAHPEDLAARTWQVRFMLNTRKYEAALNAAQEAAAAMPDNPGVLMLLGDAQLAANNLGQARSTFSRLVALEPNSVVPLLKLSDVHLSQRDYAQAVELIERALRLEPANAVAQRKLIALALATGKPEMALTVARAAQKHRPNLDYGYLFEGDIQASRRHWPEAIAAYRAALQRVPGAEAAIKLYRSLEVAGGKSEEAAKFAQEWLSRWPADVRFAVYVGESAMQRKDHAAAERMFRIALQKAPQHLAALQNLAGALMAQGKPGALVFSEQAAKLAPGDVSVLDTLALALANDGQFKRAIETQRKALALQPKSSDLRLTLAKIHLQAGSRDDARKTLDDLLLNPGSAPFAGRDEATRLRASL